MDEDAIGADLTGENQINLAPGSGIDPGRVIRLVPTSATAVKPDTAASLTSPLSITEEPRIAETRSITPAPGAPVNLAPPNPVKLAQITPIATAPGVPMVAAQPTAPGEKPVQPGTGQGMFGGPLVPVPEYDPNANPLLVQKKMLEGQRDAAQRKASNKALQFLEGDWSKKQGQEAARLSGEIQKIDQELQTQSTNQQMAKNMGLDKVMPATADAAAIHEQAIAEWRGGNYKAYIGLQGAGAGARANLYAAEGINALGKDTSKATQLYDRLGDAKTQADYVKLREQVLSEAAKGSNNFKEFGLTDAMLPKTKTEFEARRGPITAPLNQANLFVARFNRQLEQQGQPQVISDKPVADATAADFQHSNGEAIPNAHAVTLPDMGDAKGVQMQPKSKDIAKFGPSGDWHNMSPAQYETVTKQFGSEEVKGMLQKYKMTREFAETANNDRLWRSPAGIALISDELGAIGRDVAEGSKAAGSIGLTKMLDMKYGGVENFLNSATNNWAAYKAYVQGGSKGKEVKLEYRVTDQSRKGVQDVANFKLGQAEAQVGRAGGPIDTLGRYGGDLSKVGLDEKMQEMLKPVHEKALQQARLDFDKFPAVIRGDRRVLLPQGTTGPGVIPAGSYQESLKAIPVTPKAAETPAPVVGPPQVSAAGAHATASTIPGNPNGGGGGGFAAGIRAGESSSNYQAPPPINKATGKQISSASGAYQMIDETWNANKPPGAPDQAYKATAEQQDEAFVKLTAKNASALKKSDVPVNPLTLAMAHQQGAGGAASLAKAPDGANALDFVDRKAAANNAAFFWDKEGKPLTVAESKAKFAQHYRTEGGVVATSHPQSATEPGSLPYPNPKSPQEARANYNAGQRMTPEERTALDARKAAQARQATISAANVAPALLSAAGGTVGSLGGPVGAAAGSVGGGVAGGLVKNYFTGTEEQQTPAGYGKAAGWGGAQGVVGAIPGMGPVATTARAVVGGAVPAAEKYFEGAEAPEITNAAVGGVLGTAGGEAFGRTLGMVGHKIYSAFSGVAKAEVQAAAKVLAEQEPKILDATGKAVENKAYTKAEELIKDRGLDPEHAAYAYNQTAAKATKGEAIPQRPGGVEQLKAGKELEEIKNTVGDAGAAARVTPKTPIGPIPNGPVSTVRTATNTKGSVSEKYIDDAKHAERALQQPAANVSEKWGQAADARSALLVNERDAIRAGDTEKANAMRAIADNVRKYQENMVRTLMPKQHADALMQTLKNADTRYRNAVMAGGDDIVKTIAGGGKQGNQAKAAFDALSGADPSAQRMMNALVNAQNRSSQTGLLSVMATASGALTFVPVVGPAMATAGAVITIAKAKQMLSDYAVKKGAASQVTFKELMLKHLSDKTKSNVARGSAAVGSGVGAETANRVTQNLQEAE